MITTKPIKTHETKEEDKRQVQRSQRRFTKWGLEGTGWLRLILKSQTDPNSSASCPPSLDQISLLHTLKARKSLPPRTYHSSGFYFIVWLHDRHSGTHETVHTSPGGRRHLGLGHHGVPVAWTGEASTQYIFIEYENKGSVPTMANNKQKADTQQPCPALWCSF